MAVGLGSNGFNGNDNLGSLRIQDGVDTLTK